MSFPNNIEQLIDSYLEDPLFNVRVEISERIWSGTMTALVQSNGPPDGVYMLIGTRLLRVRPGRQYFENYVNSE